MRIGGFSAALLVFAGQLRGQAPGADNLSVVEGKVEDSQNRPVAASVISLEGIEKTETLKAQADSAGKFRFEGVPAGSYTIHAKLQGYEECVQGPFELAGQQTRSVLLVLKPLVTKDAADAMTFSDEPAFTVAGVTDTTAMGGHGSGPVVRNSNALSKETVSLAHTDAPGAPAQATGQPASAPEAEIRAMLARQDKADLHVELADIEESEGRPLEAIKEYERAAQMEPTEAHLFSWGAELLLHHAPEPAIEVFAKGHRLFPQSSRMMLGLGAAWYAQRSEEQAVKIFMEACDVHPADRTPYLFLGKLQVTQQVVPAGWTERMKRFVTLHPENAMAHYLYAVALLRQVGHADQSAAAETELNAAVKLDPQLGDAYLQLGILLADRNDYSGAIAALQEALKHTSTSEQAHYRLAQVYRRLGDTQKTNEEIAIFRKISEEKEAEAQRERHDIPQFIYTLRGDHPSALQPATNSH